MVSAGRTATEAQAAGGAWPIVRNCERVMLDDVSSELLSAIGYSSMQGAHVDMLLIETLLAARGDAQPGSISDFGTSKVVTACRREVRADARLNSAQRDTMIAALEKVNEFMGGRHGDIHAVYLAAPTDRSRARRLRLRENFPDFESEDVTAADVLGRAGRLQELVVLIAEALDVAYPGRKSRHGSFMAPVRATLVDEPPT